MESSELSKRCRVDHTRNTTTLIQGKHGNEFLETAINSNSVYLLQQSKPNSESAAATTTSRRPIKRAAVLVCLFKANNGDLLTKGSSSLSSHSGEVSLPGGKRDEGDADDVETALREAKEEIGLYSSFVRVVSVVEPFVNKSGLIVVPVIGILTEKKAFNLAPNAAEVETIFDAPLNMFLKDKNRREEERELLGDKFLVHYFDCQSENKNCVIWGLTAAILIRVASIVNRQPPEFSERKPKFWPPKL